MIQGSQMACALLYWSSPPRGSLSWVGSGRASTALMALGTSECLSDIPIGIVDGRAGVLSSETVFRAVFA